MMRIMPAEMGCSSLIDLPDVVQRNDFYCWPCVAMSVAKYWGVGQQWKTQFEFAQKLGTTRKNSTDPNRFYQFFKDLGCQIAMGEGLTVDDLRMFCDKGWPVACPIQEYMSGPVKAQEPDEYGHCVAVIGVGLGMIFVQDPSEDNVVRPEENDSDNARGRAMIEIAKWNDIWYDREWKHCGIAVGPPPARRVMGDLS